MPKTADLDKKREPGENQRDNIVNGALHADTFREFEEYRVSNELTSSEATRRLIRSGLENQERQLGPLIYGLGIGGSVGVIFGIGGSLDAGGLITAVLFLAIAFVLTYIDNRPVDSLTDLIRG